MRMNTSRRGFLVGGAVGVMAAACGPLAPGGGPAGAGKTTRPVKLEWAIWNGPTLLEAQKEGARVYQQKHPNLTIETVGFGPQSDNITKWLANTGPDVAMNWGTPMIDTARQGMYVTLDSYIKRDSRAVPLSDYVEFQLKAQQAPGVGQYAIPMYIAIYALLIHKPSFQKKGLPMPDDNWDWAKYADQLVKVTDRAQNVWGGLVPGNRFGGSKILMNGGEVIDPKDDRKAAFATPAGIEALQWIHDRTWKDRTWAQATEPRNAGFKDGYAMMAAGKLATWENGASWAVGDFARDHPAAVGDWDLVLWPRAKQRVSRASIDAWTVWKGTKEPEAAWEFMKFLQTTEWLDIQARLAGYQHPRVSMQDHYVDVLKKGIPALASKNLQVFSHPVKNRYARPDPIFRKDGDAWGIFGEAWTASIIENKQPVADAFRDAARRIDAAMAG